MNHSPPLLFGKSQIQFEIPSGAELTLIEKPLMTPLADPPATIRHAIQPLEGLAEGCRTACVLICDITRPVPNGLLLPPIVEALVKAGVQQITVLVATGLHRPNLGPELQQLINQGAEEQMVLPDCVTVVNHYARRDEEHAYVGTTSQGQS